MDTFVAQDGPTPQRAPGGWRFLAKAAVTLLCLYLVGRRIDAAELLDALSAVQPAALLVGFLMYLVGQLMTAYRWQLLARAAGFSCTVTDAARYFFIGMFFNHLGPSTIGGDFVRGLYLAGSPARLGGAVATVLLDRLMGLWTLVLVAAAAMTVYGTYDIPRALIPAVAAAVVALPAAWLVTPRLSRLLLTAGGRLRRIVEHDVSAYWRDKRMLVSTFCVSVIFHVWQIAAVVVVGLGVGIGVDTAYYFIFHPLVAVFAGLPMSVAGYGIRELGYVYFLSDVAAVPGELAVAFAVAWLVVMLAASAVGGLVFWLGGARLPSFGAAGDQSAAASQLPSSP